MPSNVYANGNSIACKASMDKVIVPPSDVCMSPPSPPAGPIPIPYPNASFSKDTKSGSKKVKIGNKPVMLKNKSYYKSSPLGNEAATRSFGAGVVSHQITGKTFFAAWSMDVKFEGKNVDRHLDITQSNSSNPGNGVGTDANKMSPGSDEEPKCDCCGKPAHSQMQAKGEEISEDKFYSPTPPPGEQKAQFAIDAKNLLKEVRSGPCKNLLPPEKPKKATKCNKYYVTDPNANEKARIENDWNDYRDKYYRKFKVPSSTDIGHRVPKSAGGCPTGPGNLMPVPDGCKDTEDKLSRLQERAIKYHRRLRGMI